MKQLLTALISISCLLMSCEKSSSGDTTLKIYLGDNLRSIPFNAQEVNVEIQGVKVKYKGPVEDISSTNPGNSDDWVWLETKSGIYNLIDLYTGKTTLIASGPVPGATINEMRFVLGKKNSVKVGGTTYPITLPAGNEFGFKIAVQQSLTLPYDTLQIDFNTAKSLQYTTGAYKLFPEFAIR